MIHRGIAGRQEGYTELKRFEFRVCILQFLIAGHGLYYIPSPIYGFTKKMSQVCLKKNILGFDRKKTGVSCEILHKVYDGGELCMYHNTSWFAGGVA